MLSFSDTKTFRKSLVTKYYAGRDKSHGVTHVNKVRENALYIYSTLTVVEKKLFVPSNKQLTLWEIDIYVFISLCAELHDVTDHKYVKEYDAKTVQLEISRLLIHKLSFCEDACRAIWNIVNNVSFSRQLRCEREDLGIWNNYLYVISDADKLEALGLTSFNRMIIYSIQFLKMEDVQDIYQHIYGHTQKLLRMYPEKIRKKWVFIIYSESRKRAWPLHEELKDIANNERRATNLISAALRKFQYRL